jgi:hypothetical protein
MRLGTCMVSRKQKRYRAENWSTERTSLTSSEDPPHIENDIDTQRHIDEKAFGNALFEFMK